LLEGGSAVTAPTPERPDLTRDQFSSDYSYWLATGRRPTPTPEYLRGMADALDPVAEATLGRMMWHTVHDAKDAFRAAADEVDRLRAEIILSPDERIARAIASASMKIDFVPAEDVHRLRTVIEDAPHQMDCSTQTHAGDCDCWKADV
jgi:hypothetical protein